MIDVVMYDDQWPLRFDELKRTLVEALKGVSVVAIEHVGSTAVQGLAAKPIIDIDLVVEAADVEAASLALASIGYVPRGDLGIPDRYAFRAPSGSFPHHTYIVVNGCLALRNLLAVRDALRSDRALRDEYGALKVRLAASAHDIDRYVEGKTKLLLRILAKAGIARHQIEEIEQINKVR